MYTGAFVGPQTAHKQQCLHPLAKRGVMEEFAKMPKGCATSAFISHIRKNLLMGYPIRIPQTWDSLSLLKTTEWEAYVCHERVSVGLTLQRRCK